MTSIKAALIVVDLQEDFCPPNGPLAVPNGRSIAPTVLSLLRLSNFALRVATQDWHPQDWHPQDHISFASNHSAPDNEPFKSTYTVTNPLNPTETCDIPLWPDHCVQDTPGAEFIRELGAGGSEQPGERGDGKSLEKEVEQLFDHIIQKGQDPRVEMFSAFKDSFRSPCVSESALSRVLKEAGITTVFVVGLAADYCVKHTAIDAVGEGFEAWVVRDAVRGVDASEEGWARLREEFRERGVGVVDAEEVRRRLG